MNKTSNIVLSNIHEISAKDANSKRLLAYVYEENGDYDNALEAYQNIVDLRPEELQSYRDLANAYVKAGYFKKGWDEYRKYLAIKKDSLKADGLDEIVRQEMLQLVEQHSEEIDVDKSKFNLDHIEDDISILVQWNNPNAEFELQFVGPTGHYYVWKHLDEEKQNLLADERSSGSYTKSFSIQDIGEGPWMINTKYLGNKEGTATYLKFSIKNRKQDEETIKVIKMKKSDVNYRSLNISENEVISLFK